MEQLEERLRGVAARVDAARVAHARAVVQRESASARVDEARQALLAEFGVETPEDGQRVLAELEGAVARELAAVETALERTAGV